MKYLYGDSFALVLFLEKVAFASHEFIHPFGITKEEEMQIHRMMCYLSPANSE